MPAICPSTPPPARCLFPMCRGKTRAVRVDKGLRPGGTASQGGVGMARILRPEDVVRRIAAECAFVDKQGGVGIRLEPAAAILRQHGEQFRAAARHRSARKSPNTPRLL